jgi:hypothetical protein
MALWCVVDHGSDADDLRLRELNAKKYRVGSEDLRTAHLEAAEGEFLTFWKGKDERDKIVGSDVTSTSKNPYIDSFDLVYFWTDKERASRYPIMHPLILKVLSCMLSNNEVERVRRYWSLVYARLCGSLCMWFRTLGMMLLQQSCVVHLP